MSLDYSRFDYIAVLQLITQTMNQLFFCCFLFFFFSKFLLIRYLPAIEMIYNTHFSFA